MMDSLEEIWNSAVQDDFEHLQFPGFRDYAERQREFDLEGPIAMLERIVYSPNY